MISRKLLWIDRLATTIAALLLLAVGALGVWWWSDSSPFPASSNTASVERVVREDWFPWAAGAAGVFLVLLAIRWIAAHLDRNDVKQLTLRGSGSEGALVVTAGKVAGAAAEAFQDTLGVRSARGTVTRDRGQLIAKINATIDDDADLAHVAERADLVSAQLRQVLGRNDTRCRFELRTAGIAQSITGSSSSKQSRVK